MRLNHSSIQSSSSTSTRGAINTLAVLRQARPNSSPKRRAPADGHLAGAAQRWHHGPRRPSARLLGPVSLKREVPENECLVRVAIENPDQPEVIGLIAELDAYQDTLYPAEARYALDLMSLKKPNVVFVVARDEANLAVGCGAVVVTEDQGELKRMYVRQENRGRGVAQRVLLALEASAAKLGCQELLLETGPYQPEALAFYKKQGYVRRGSFGTYPDHPLSVFMGKGLAPAHTGA